MFQNNSWLNSDQTLLTAWSGSTLFTGLQALYHLLGTLNPITYIGWFITTCITLIAAYSKWRLNRAEEEERLSEARKKNAEAKKIEAEITSEFQRLIAEQCKVDDCLYRVFYNTVIEKSNNGIE